MSREEVAELRNSRINDYRASGERVAAWCERHQVTSHQLFYWMRKLKKADRQTPSASEPKWVALSLEGTTPDAAPPILVRVGTVAVEVRVGFEPSVFADVVRTLKTLC
ncbi:MAG TPA: helix-turn-helix domain-containing protein [Symbiobacteriaceae bacterium]|jgi:transposase-like protein